MDCAFDIIFVLGDSGSVGVSDFELTKSFLSQLVSRLDIDSGNTRVGFLVFSTHVETTISLTNDSSVASIQSAISSLNYTGGGTSTHAALSHVRSAMLTSAAGDRSSIANVVVLLTDGQSDNVTDTKVSINQLYFTQGRDHRRMKRGGAFAPPPPKSRKIFWENM